MKDTIGKLLRLFNKKEKRKLIIIFFMMLLAALFETIGIGMIIPIIGIVMDPTIVEEQTVLNSLYTLLQFQSLSTFMVFLVMAVLSIFIIKNLYLMLFQYIQTRTILNQQVKLSQHLFHSYLIKDYTFHLQQNSANLLRNVTGEVSKVFQGIIMSTFQLITEILVIFCLICLLVVHTPIATISTSLIIGLCVFVFFKYFRIKISKLGKEQQKLTGETIKWVNQGFGASKEIKVSGKESFFVQSYKHFSQKQANNNLQLRILEHAPRLFIETILISVIFFTLLIVIVQGMNTTEVVSTMALFAMAAFRLLPSINRVIASITTIRYSYPALEVLDRDFNPLIESNRVDVLEYKHHLTDKERLYQDSIVLKDVSFRYPEQSSYSIKNVSLSIPIGNSVAFIGESGAGKTTIIDLILGVLKPEKGNILVDGLEIKDHKIQWQRKIGYIPQTIFLSDDSIRANVAFGIKTERISDDDVWRALDQAQLGNFVRELPNQLDTSVGESGVRLSGGQRQRIGIARALYHDPEILFMDEATSALDNGTEEEIMKAINGLKGEKTIIIIAHRLSTIENCDIVYRIHKGKVAAIENQKQSKIVNFV
ncbi:ABC transporter ATP-binding protein [Sutcliffiella horikoshii]|uniref:ABC transporter ATP-binding protein n=1 Tax=Sutcliffiella horikoshii TaxID=79883 RepID=A0AA94WQ92_9BACI|nr:ABC transporter ATP-binding protein [Sutcliffiella horikoshii]TYS60085.1 ABC transporter ATP-binding protein [Sutcliffiella horikoshii]